MPTAHNSHSNYFSTFLKFLLAYALVMLFLSGEGNEIFERLHLLLDTSNGILTLLIAMYLFAEQRNSEHRLQRYLVIGFGLTAIATILHALTGIEWNGNLAWIQNYAHLIRPATWPPSSYVLPLSLAWMLWLNQRKVSLRTRTFAIGMSIATLALFVLAWWLPKYVNTGYFGISRPTLIPLVFIWLWVITQCWRDRAQHPLYEAMIWMSSLLLLADLWMVFSTSPHEKFTMIAHTGKLIAYLYFHLIQMRIAAEGSATRQQAELELRDSEQRFRFMLETCPTAARVAKAGGHEIIFFNHSYAALINTPPDRIAGAAPSIYYANKADYADILLHLGRGEQILDRLVELTIPDAGTKWAQATYLPIQYQGEPAVLGWFHDITQLRMAERSVHESAVRTQAILNNVLDGIISIDEHGTVDSFNKAAEHIFGYMASEVVGSNVKMLMPEPYHHEHDGYLRNFVSTGVKKIIGSGREVVGQRKDGSVFPMDLGVSEMQLLDKRMFTGVVRDVSDRKKAENLQAQFAAIIESSADAIMSKTLDGIVTSWNSAAEKMFGYSEHEMLAQPMALLIPKERSSEEQEILAKLRRGEHIDHFETIRKNKNGKTFPISVTLSPIKDKSGAIIGASKIARDITERVKMERMKSEFISTVSHELRTPLTSIRGSLALIAGGVVGELPATIKPLVEIAHKNSERLILLVNDILDMEKIEAGKMEFDMQPIKLMPLLNQALDSNRAYGEQFKVSYELESTLPEAMIKVDANRLMQVLANLLSNAAKFSLTGGKVLVGVEAVGPHIRIAVKDNGPGISDEFKEQIFQKFAQADASDTKKKGGTGLDLSITKAIIEQMGGSIGFTSQPHVLTTFFVELPVWQEVKMVASTLSDKPGLKRVLICEDDHDIAALLQLMLEQAELSADIACDAAQAKQMLAQQSYAAMTLDLAMPDQDGISLIRELRANPVTATLPIVVVSAQALEGQKELSSNAFSVIDWIGKPIDQAQLVTALKQAVGQVSDARSQVLHVEDDADIAHVVKAIVGDTADVDHALTLADARRMLKAKHYDLAILDISLPDGSGLELLPQLNSAAPAIPVMVFSATEVLHEELTKVKSALMKSRTDNAQLLATIKRLIGIA